MSETDLFIVALGLAQLAWGFFLGCLYSRPYPGAKKQEPIDWEHEARIWNGES